MIFVASNGRLERPQGSLAGLALLEVSQAVNRKPEHPGLIWVLWCERTERLDTLSQQSFFEDRVLNCTERSTLEAHKGSPRDPRPKVQAPRGLLYLGVEVGWGVLYYLEWRKSHLCSGG